MSNLFHQLETAKLEYDDGQGVFFPSPSHWQRLRPIQNQLQRIIYNQSIQPLPPVTVLTGI
jgi:hypothetical protein